MELKAGIVCDRGLNPKRPVNQDRYLAIPARGLFAVFDGVGGQRAGEVASQNAAETIEEAIKHDSARSASDMIRRAIQFANRDIFEMAEANPEYKSMATTVALLHIDGGQATIAHVGDSRVYRLEEGTLYRETIDHTDLNDDIRAGRLDWEQARDNAENNVINRALGVESEVEVEMKSIDVRDGSRFLLCSDGIYRHMGDEEIARVLEEQQEPQRAADELKRIVHERGAEDNLTAIIVQLGADQAEALGSGGLPRTGGTTARNLSEVRAKTTAHPLEARIQVELASGSRPDALNTSRQLQPEAPAPSLSRAIMYVLLVAVLMAGSFYLGLRASDWFRRQSSAASAGMVDPVTRGREAFDRKDMQNAIVEFDAAVRLDPANSTARYWLGRALLEQREYQRAAQSFEEAVTIDPSLLDGYIQGAAAYEAMGERSKATAMLARYAEQRKKEQR